MKTAKENIAKYLYDFVLGKLLGSQDSEFIKNMVSILEYLIIFKCMTKIL